MSVYIKADYILNIMLQLRPIGSESETKQKSQITIDITNKMLTTLDKNIQFHSKNRDGSVRTYGKNLTLVDMDVTIYVDETKLQIPKINFGYSGYTEHFQDLGAGILTFPDLESLNSSYETLQSALSKVGFNNVSKQTLI